MAGVGKAEVDAPRHGQCLGKATELSLGKE